MALLDVVGLATLVILSANDQQIVIAINARLHADVVIRIAGIPEQRERHRAAR